MAIVIIRVFGNRVFDTALQIENTMSKHALQVQKGTFGEKTYATEVWTTTDDRADEAQTEIMSVLGQTLIPGMEFGVTVLGKPLDEFGGFAQREELR